MMALLAKKDEKCAFQLDSVEAGDGPGAMCVTGLQFKYDSSKELLRDSTLTIHAYRRYGLIGRNGEGKSSLLRILPEFAPPGTRIHVVHQVRRPWRPSFLAAVLAEIQLCNVCSCQEILRCNGRG
jgi:ABC-type transport system involved in cytochrome bd biosynthesis fused ATPase/permease subunit